MTICIKVIGIPVAMEAESRRMRAPPRTGPRTASSGSHLSRHYHSREGRTRWGQGQKMHRTRRGSGAVVAQMECCISQES